MNWDELLKELKDRKASGTLSTTTSLAELKAEAYNEQWGDLSYGECAICRNKGWVASVKDGVMTMTECSCVPLRKSRRRIAHSGLADQLERYTFDSFETAEPWQVTAKSLALKYAEKPEGWMVALGKTGTGKTHLCTAAASKLMERMSVVYMPWRIETPRIKSLITDAKLYDDEIRRLTDVRCLYIDDFLKGSITDADKNLAFAIIDKRYSDIKKLTILSSEMSLESMMEIDEAIGGRIWERAKTKLLFSGENYRTRS